VAQYGNWRARPPRDRFSHARSPPPARPRGDHSRKLCHLPPRRPEDAHLERLYFGRNIGDSAVVSDSAWAVFIREVLTPSFPEGATVWDAAGQWRAPDGTMVRERGFVVELLHLVTPDVERRVQTVMDEYKHRFAQQSVLRVVTKVRASF
jgi:hypothetical protein